ncbi:MAG: pentapeptide repeat-containing protein [Oscillatoriophycideae cyanobacterium NC_groundwater_1537_Pr4_S-0.65um_50_18]|nr:pentapeptide repeat-containing protein [Oscillatoriophycideae cyanobacterium NC_groundwater_1537_Pr4_S-0.65um_50_18]
MIVGFASPVVQNKLQRSELVIKLLKQLNLDPDHPPADFTAVYQYTLVEYGIGKPKPVLELFRQAEIQEIFRRALDQNNPSLLLKEGEAFLSGHQLGEQIQALGIDARQEFYQFAAVFIEVAKRTRTPAEVLANQRLESLHRQIGSIQERLHRLPTLEGMRTEMARLAAQSYPLLPTIASPAAIQERQFQESQCRAFALAQQMKGWFETLGYRFESYEVWQDDYFEWMIDIPVRRGRYDRILVRGIDGEAGLRDIRALRQSVETQRADEGWLVTARRISRAAREEIEKEENHDLGCYTFDELLDQDADFGGYLDWLESEIQRRGIEQKYVPLACTKEEIDPDTKQRIGVSRYDDRDGWIDGYIDLWLDDPAKEHISVLGEFGTGKTWFAFHYASQALQRYREAQQRGVERPRLPLVIPLRDYAKAVSVESLFSEFFFRKHEVRSLTYSAFEQLNRMGKLLLIFDGFDEMAARVDRQEMINNFWELAKVVVPGAKVILTCRTEHFPEAREGRALLNAQLQASIANLTGEMPQFEVLELEKFNDEQIRQVLLLQAEPITVDQVLANPQLVDLARRPVMTELILEALPDIEAGKPVDMSRVYLYAVRRKMERDIKAERTFTSLAEKLYFLCELSWEMLSTDRMSLNYREFPDRIRRLFGSVVQEEKDLDHWHYDMMGQTMLIRNADGDYMPAHRSLLEFFVAYKFAAELGALALDFLELARAQSCLDTRQASQDYTWSAYFQRSLDQSGRSVAIAPLNRFVSEDLEKLRSGFGNTLLSKAVIELMQPLLAETSPLLNAIAATAHKTVPDVGYIGGNAVTLLVNHDKFALNAKNLAHTVLQGADLTNANLRDVNLTGADLSQVRFTQAFGTVLCCAFHPNGHLFATGEASGSIHLWSTEDFQKCGFLKGHGDWVRSLAFNADGSLLISTSSDQTIKIWDVRTETCINTLTNHSNRVYAVAIAPNDQVFATCSADHTIKVWDFKTGKCIQTLLDHRDIVWAVAFSPDGKTLVSSSRDRTIKLWNWQTGACIKTLEGHPSRVNFVGIVANGNTLISAGDRIIKLWDLQTGDCFKSLEGHTEKILHSSISPNGALLASSSHDHTIRVWDLHTGDCLHVLNQHSDIIRAIAFHPDGKFLLSGSDDQTMRLWAVESGDCVMTRFGQISAINDIAITPDGNSLVNTNDDATISVWDLSQGEYRQTLQQHTRRVWSVAISPDGKTLVSASSDRTLKIWDFATGQCTRTLSQPSSVFGVAISPDGKKMLSSGSDLLVLLWDLDTGECLREVQKHKRMNESSAVRLSNYLIAASAQTQIHLWDINTGERLRTLTGHTGSIWAIAISPDEQWIATGSFDQTVKIWDTHTGDLRLTLKGHRDRVRAIAVSPDGLLIASAGDDAEIRLWNVQTGDCQQILVGHQNRIRGLQFHPNGKAIVSGSFDETIRLWDIETGACIKKLINKPYAGMNITGVQGLAEAEKETLKALGAIEN